MFVIVLNSVLSLLVLKNFHEIILLKQMKFLMVHSMCYNGGKKIIHLIEGEKNSKDLFLEIKLVSPICTHYKKILVSEREVNKLTTFI